MTLSRWEELYSAAKTLADLHLLSDLKGTCGAL